LSCANTKLASPHLIAPVITGYLLTGVTRWPGGAEEERRHNGDVAVANTQVPTEVSPVASRPYRTTRPLYLQVARTLDQLGLATVGSPTTAVLMALYVTGLVLLDAHPTQ
jgi:hypothetical protein